MVTDDKLDFDTLFNDKKELYKILNRNHAFESVLISVSFIDKCLTIALKNRLIKDKVTDELLNHSGPLGEFMAKAKICLSLSLIKKETYVDIYTIAKIRNLFAHSHSLLGFENSQIQDRCNNLKGYTKVFPDGKLNSLHPDPKALAKHQFVITVVQMIHGIMGDHYLEKIIK